MSVVDVLPFVPTTWIAANARCGSPRSASRRCIRSSPKCSGHGESEASQSRSGRASAIVADALPPA